MSNLENLTSRILEDANTEAQSILEEASREESRILNKSREEAEKRRRVILDKAAEEARLKKERIISNTELQCRNNKLSAKQKAIENVFDRVVNSLKNLDREQYLSFLKNSILAADIYGDEAIVVNSKDRAYLSTDFINELNMALNIKGKRGNISLSPEVREIEGGFILTRRGIEINYTYNAIVASLRDELENDVASILFS